MNVLCIIYGLYSHEYAVNKHMHICVWGSALLCNPCFFVSWVGIRVATSHPLQKGRRKKGREAKKESGLSYLKRYAAWTQKKGKSKYAGIVLNEWQ